MKRKTTKMKALIEERRNIRKEDKEQMKNVSKKIKKCIRCKKKIKKARTDSANTGGVQGNQEHFEPQICEEKKTYAKDKE